MEAPSFSVDHLDGNRVKGATLILEDRAMYLQNAEPATGLWPDITGYCLALGGKSSQAGGEGQCSVKVETFR
jgi:hypothetical protein